MDSAAPKITGPSTSSVATQTESATSRETDSVSPVPSASESNTVSANATITDVATSVPTQVTDSSSFEWASETSSDSWYSASSSTTEEAYIPTQTYLVHATYTPSPSSSTSEDYEVTESVTSTSETSVAMPSTATVAANVPTIIVPYNSPAATSAAAGSKSAENKTDPASLISILLNADNYPWDFVVSRSSLLKGSG